jgi:hypothetical protein
MLWSLFLKGNRDDVQKMINTIIGIREKLLLIDKTWTYSYELIWNKRKLKKYSELILVKLD